jgi:hypothetical protein
VEAIRMRHLHTGTDEGDSGLVVNDESGNHT